MKLKISASIIGLAVGLLGASGASAAPRACSLDSIKAIAPPDAVIDSVKPMAGPVAHCEVLGHITTTNPGPGHVEFSVLLPDQRFNNRFYFVGEGAAAGFVPTATMADPMNAGYLNTTLKLLGEGFVVAGTDTALRSACSWSSSCHPSAAIRPYGSALPLSTDGEVQRSEGRLCL